jgi:hypothetical protein
MSRKDVAREIQRRVDLAGDELPTSIESFIETHAGRRASYRYDSTWCLGNMEALLLVAEQGGPPMLARNGNAPPGDR